MSTAIEVASGVSGSITTAPVERREASAYQREHRVAGDELERRMRRINLPFTAERGEVVSSVGVDDRGIV